MVLHQHGTLMMVPAVDTGGGRHSSQTSLSQTSQCINLGTAQGIPMKETKSFPCAQKTTLVCWRLSGHLQGKS